MPVLIHNTDVDDLDDQECTLRGDPPDPSRSYYNGLYSKTGSLWSAAMLSRDEGYLNSIYSNLADEEAVKTKIRSSIYPGLMQTNLYNLSDEGWENNGPAVDGLRDYFSNSCVFSGVGRKNVVSNRWPQTSCLKDYSEPYCLGDIPTDRTYWTGGTEGPGGGGVGGGGPVPVPFLLGPGWQTYRYYGLGLNDNNLLDLRYIDAVRPPGQHGFRPHGDTDRHATIRIMDRDGKCWYATTNILILSIQKSSADTMISIQTFDGAMPFFGEPAHRVFSIKAALLNAKEYDWAREWQWNWDNYLKGSTTLENDARFFMLYDAWLIGGHILGYSGMESSNSPYLEQMIFQVFVTDYIPLPELQVISISETEKAERWRNKGNYIETLPDKSKGQRYRRPGMTLDEAMADFRETNKTTEWGTNPVAKKEGIQGGFDIDPDADLAG